MIEELPWTRIDIGLVPSDMVISLSIEEPPAGDLTMNQHGWSTEITIEYEVAGTE